MAARITRFLHSRNAMLLSVAFMALAAWHCYAPGQPPLISADRGIALPSANCWITSGAWSLAASLAANAAILGLMIFLNRTFNLLRGMTMLFAVLFAFMQASTPELLTQFATGPLLAITAAFCIALMFGSYARPWLRRRVFLVFFLLSAGAATQYAFAVYIPVMALCCAQMRILSMRAAVAALLGIITPWWLLLGLGIASPEGIHLPSTASVFSILGTEESLQLAIAALLGAVVFIVSVVLDFFRTMAYNARARSYNGTILLTGFITIAAMVADYRNLTVYLPLLNMCAALQCTQFFVLHRTERSWIGIACVLAAYISLFIWNIA